MSDTEIDILNISQFDKSFVSYENIEYYDVSYDVLLDKMIPLDQLKSRLSLLLDVIDVKECYIVYNKIE